MEEFEEWFVPLLALAGVVGGFVAGLKCEEWGVLLLGIWWILAQLQLRRLRREQEQDQWEWWEPD